MTSRSRSLPTAATAVFPPLTRDLAELSAGCARAFDQLGLRPGDRVLLWGNNSVEWVAAFFGCVLRGIVAVPLDAAGRLEFAQRVVAEVKPKLLAGDLALLEKLPAQIPRLGFSTFGGLPAPDYAPWPGLSRETPLQIIFTSGTTAEPKGIVHTHGNVLASLDPLEKEMGKYLRYERLIHPLRILHTLPLSHVFGQFMGLWVPPLLTAEVHFEDRLQAPRLARLIHQERISVLAAVPRVLDLLRGWLEGESPGLPARLAAARGERVGKRWWRFREYIAAWVLNSGRSSPEGPPCPPIWKFFGPRPGFRSGPGVRDDGDHRAGHPEPPLQDRARQHRQTAGRPGSADRGRWRDPGAGGLHCIAGLAARRIADPRGGMAGNRRSRNPQ